MVYIGVLWNTVNQFKNEIIDDISQFGNVLKTYEIDLWFEYDSFVRKIYENDGIAEWKVNLKLDAMNKSENKKVVIMFIQIDNTKKE